MRNLKITRPDTKSATRQGTPDFARLDACGHELAGRMEQTAREYFRNYPETCHPRTLVTAAIRMLYIALKAERDIGQAKKGLSRAYAQIHDWIDNTAMAFFGRIDSWKRN